MHCYVASAFPKKVTYNEIGSARIPLPKAGKEQAMGYLQHLETLRQARQDSSWDVCRQC